MKIPQSIINRLNFRYVTAIDVHGKLPNDSIWIAKDIAAFIDKAIRKGNAVSLDDIDYLLSEKYFWDIEHFEDFCRNVYFTFKPGFTTKLTRQLPDIDQEDLSYFQQVLGQHPYPYKDAIGHPDDPYLHFIGKKIQSLSKTGILSKAVEMDKENRRKLLNALQQKKIVLQNIEVPRPLKHLNQKTPFTDMLQPTNGSVNNTKLFIQQQLTLAGIPFELLIPKPVTKTRTNKNPDGFAGAVASMITTFKDLGYFKDDFSFPEILNAFLKETGNSIGKLNNFKRNYLADNYYLRYKASLEDLALKKYRENA
ncbi:MAG TPA: hypothetical protein PKE30_00530 [Niabella sp.]|nr:hypothetical protein [Niabella sp.]